MSARISLLAVAVAVSIALFWLTEVPLGVSGEWTWNRIRHEVLIESLLGLIPVLIAGVVYLAIAHLGAERIGRARQGGVAIWLLGLMAAAGGWLFTVQEAPPEGHRLSKSPWVLYYPAMTGYFHKARYEIADTANFLRDYEKLMFEGDVLHVGTHPPGLFVLYRGLLSITADSPALVEWLNWSQPQSVREGLDVISENVTRPDRILTEQDRAVLWLGILLAHASVCWVVVPLFLVLRWSESRETAWKTCCFWSLIPTVAIFLPKDDVFFTGIVMSFLWCWLSAVRSRGAVAVGFGALAGAVGFGGLFMSLVFLPIGLAALLAGSLAIGLDTEDAIETPALADASGWSRGWLRGAFFRIIKQWPACLGGAVAVGGLILLLRGVWGLDLLAVWRLNVRNHAGFYDQYARSYGQWLLVNGLELILALGVPLGALVVIAIRRGIWSQLVARRASVWAIVGVWGFLWISGKNSGEAARLWIPLMPLAVWLLPGALASEGDDESRGRSNREWLWCLGLQAVACAATVARVSGFHFGG